MSNKLFQSLFFLYDNIFENITFPMILNICIITLNNSWKTISNLTPKGSTVLYALVTATVVLLKYSTFLICPTSSECWKNYEFISLFFLYHSSFSSSCDVLSTFSNKLTFTGGYQKQNRNRRVTSEGWKDKMFFVFLCMI